MKELLKQYLDEGLSRRKLLAGLSAVGVGASAAQAMAQSLAPFAGQPGTAPPAAAVREVTGNGGQLFVQQLKAAGIDHIFFNPSTGDHPIFDALVDEPGIQVIKGVHEGAVVAMADGYARASGKIGMVIVADVGLCNAMTQMVNSWKDQIPLLVCVACVDQETLGRELFQSFDHADQLTQPITKWCFQAQATNAIPETLRRGLKFASTPPTGPVFLAFPNNILREHGKAAVWDHAKFDVPMRIRPAKDQVEAAARLLIEAKNPMISVGDEITQCGAEKEVVALAELLGIPVAGQAGTGALGYWSKPFPTRHPLYIGNLLREMRQIGKPDLLLNLGNRWGERLEPGVTLISVRRDPTSLARMAPVDVPMVADLRLAAQDLAEAVKSLATAPRLKEIAAARAAKVQDYWKGMESFRRELAGAGGDSGPITMARLGVELEAALDRDTCYVADVDSGKKMDSLMSFGGEDKPYFSTVPNILGWGMAAATGVKIARPDSPVVAVVGDGSFLFSGPQPLWSMARYQVPVTTIVLNNKSYNNERNRIWNNQGKQFHAGRDMTCYNGSPDVDYAKTAQAFGVQGETVSEPAQIRPALARAKQATVEGRPYLLDVVLQRDGIGAGSEWYPPYSVAALRTRKV